MKKPYIPRGCDQQGRYPEAAEARWAELLERERLLRVYFALGYFREMAEIRDDQNRSEQMADEAYQAYLEGINCARGHLYQLGEIHATPEGPDDHPLDEVAK